MANKKLPDNQITVYQTPDGKINIEVLYANENIWLPQKRMADLFGCTADNVSLHLKNIFEEKELDEEATTEEFSVVQREHVPGSAIRPGGSAVSPGSSDPSDVLDMLLNPSIGTVVLRGMPDALRYLSNASSLNGSASI
jgi:hypothetical protein